MKPARNVAVILLIALGAAAIPGGNDTANLFAAASSIAFAALIAYLAARIYRDRRVDIYGLGDRDRATLYLAVGVAVVVFAASSRLLSSAAGTIVELVLLGACVGALLRVYRAWQRY
jgi:hypothetical protein